MTTALDSHKNSKYHVFLKLFCSACMNCIMKYNEQYYLNYNTDSVQKNLVIPIFRTHSIENVDLQTRFKFFAR